MSSEQQQQSPKDGPPPPIKKEIYRPPFRKDLNRPPPPLKKDIYQPSKVVSNRPQSEIDLWLSDHQVTLTGQNIPRPVFEFNEAGFPRAIVDQLSRNYQKPTIIQSISWPVVLSGRDIISVAKTGSGKTLGFILPAIVHTLAQPRRQRGQGPSVLVLLPTRELAQQVLDVATEYATIMGLSSTCLFGGAPKHGQSSDLRRGIDFCIATPGRLSDFLRTGTVSLSRCTYLVLDEADRMLDMGFEPQIREIVSHIHADRQTLLFSATWPKEVRGLAADFQTDPVFLNVGSMDLAANHSIQQTVEVLDEYGKQKRLFELLDGALRQKEPRVIVFVATKRKADDLTQVMCRGGWPALSIHGDKKQQERDRVLAEFKQGRTPILLATDVAARGLDVDDIKLVVNYDYANNSEDYVHRIGRTARSGKSGVAHTFFTVSDAPKARDLIKILEEAKQFVPDELYRLVSSRGGGASFATGSNRNFRGPNVGGGGPSGGGGGRAFSGNNYRGGNSGVNSSANSNGLTSGGWYGATANDWFSRDEEC